ncbi:MobF family relaxase [Tautonia marina]|uniref:MobF family relaxase n=1 Tax=Tautonia marina TaxID=2653855 RepID=UPI0012609655|nr:MobF family relaxase [Tautonia marina]
MLRMKPVGTGKEAARRAELYYARSDGGYYHGEHGLHAEWAGRGAAMLGLEGPPEFDQFRNMLHGLDPFTGEQLTARLRDNRIPAWDVTASVPKGVTHAIEGGDVRVHEALWESFREALAMLEGYATTRVRVDGKHEDRITGNLVAYAVEHAETRPTVDESLPEDHPWRVMPDEDRHIHGVVLNLTFDDAEGRWKAVKFRPLMDLRKFFDRSFDAILAKKLSGLGYEIETKWQNSEQGGSRYYSWDIRPAPSFEPDWQSALEKSSRRTRDIDATEAAIVAENRELDATAPDSLSTVARDRLAATSRQTKRDDLTLEECREYWRSRQTGAERRAIAETIKRAMRGENGRPENTPERAVAFAMRHHFEQESTLPPETLMTTALERSLGAASPEDIERELKRQGVILVERDGERVATTPELLAEERGMADWAMAGRGAVAPIGVSGGLEREYLNRGQWEAVTGLLTSENRVNLIEGPAGAGKSSLLKKFAEGAALQGQAVTWLGTTATSVKVLNQEGFEADTLARFLLDEKMQAAAQNGRVVVDESSMLSHADAVKLMEVVKRQNLKLIVVGDPRQHGSIGRGAFMRLLKDYGHIRPFRLTEILRQESPEYREAAGLLYEGKAAEGFDALDRLGWVHEMANGEERVQRMAEEYVAAAEEFEHLPPQARVLAVAPTHAEANLMTAEIRSRLREKGRLGSEEREVLRLMPVMTSLAERSESSTYRPGDVIQFHQNAKGFRKGERLVVTDPNSVPVSQAERFSLYRPETLSLSTGDVVRFTGTVKSLDGKHRLKNGDTQVVSGFDRKGNIVLENGWKVSRDAGHLRHGYVETSMGSQGRTVKRVILGMSSMSLPATSMEQMYVSATRAKQQLSLFTDDKEAVRERIQKSSLKRLALDLMPAAKPDPAREEQERRQRHLARRRKLRLFDTMRAAWSRAFSRNGTEASPADRSPVGGYRPEGFTHAERLRSQQQEHGHGR